MATPRARALSISTASSSKGPSNALDLCLELRRTIEANQGSLDQVSERLLKLVEMLEGSFVQSFVREAPPAAVSKDDLRVKHLEKMEKFMKLIPEKRLTRVIHFCTVFVLFYFVFFLFFACFAGSFAVHD